MYHALGYGTIMYLQATLTFEMVRVFRDHIRQTKCTLTINVNRTRVSKDIEYTVHISSVDIDSTTFQTVVFFLRSSLFFFSSIQVSPV